MVAGRVWIGPAVLIFMVAFGTLAAADSGHYQPVPYVQIEHPEWSRSAAIYELNTRQFTPEGTFTAAAAHLPRLKELGVSIIWLMPVQPIGGKNRKGSLGSPYSIRDYLGVNPSLGDLESLKSFVAAAHELGMRVILDWVANHTAWDNVLLEKHPEWYSRNWKGELHPTPWTDWSDIIELDYSQPGLRQYMTNAMKYWVKEVGVDGFRCDMAGYVPLDFWNGLRSELDAIKPVFMLAEWETRDLHANAFDASYAWTWYHSMHDVAQGRAGIGNITGYYGTNQKAWPDDSMRLMFLSNHDENAWNGTQFEQFGDALENAIALSVVGEGIPLIYNGQEAGNRKRLAFFEKDSIEWKKHSVGDLYQKLLALKKRNSALWNGRWGAEMVGVPNSAQDAVFSFVRANESDRVFAVFNFSPQDQSVRFSDSLFRGNYRDVMNGESVSLGEDSVFDIKPWTFRLFESTRQ
jgi:1,4-alpha-glucan branching enzyme